MPTYDNLCASTQERGGPRSVSGEPIDVATTVGLVGRGTLSARGMAGAEMAT
jgi:hypothetical protein